ncbi:13337_t:CDS:2 [Funneliformis geosporum]|nr:13337_t:CDS:2 [Funneliformis geosporum]
MPKQKASFWSEFKVVFDINGKEKYKCKTCSSTWVKNASRLKEHIEQCKGIDAETGYTRAQGTKRKKQQKLDEYNYIFTSKDQIVLESLLIRALFSAALRSTIAEDHLCLNSETKLLIASNTFRNNLEKFQKFLESFAIYIKKLEGDESLLSNAFLEYQQLKVSVILTYKLDPQYHGNRLNAQKWDVIIEKEIIQLVGEEYKDIVLIELLEKQEVAIQVLSIPATLAVKFANLRAIDKPITLDEVDVEPDFSDLYYLDLEESDVELDEF